MAIEHCCSGQQVHGVHGWSGSAALCHPAPSCIRALTPPQCRWTLCKHASDGCGQVLRGCSDSIGKRTDHPRHHMLCLELEGDHALLQRTCDANRRSLVSLQCNFVHRANVVLGESKAQVWVQKQRHVSCTSEDRHCCWPAQKHKGSLSGLV